MPKYVKTDLGGATVAAGVASYESSGQVGCYFTKLTLSEFSLGTSGDDAAKAIGAKIFTFPAGEIIVDHATMVGTVLADISVKTAANSEVGLGTVVGSGANATLGAVNAACENICGPVVIGAYDDTAVVGVAVAGPAQPFLRIAASGGLAHDVFLNTATTWADVEEAGDVTFTGTVTLAWRKVS